MASESTSSQQSSHLSPSSKVNFKCEDGIIAYNNAVALLEHPNVLYNPMLSFLSNCCISTALTRQPSTTYVEYLEEFWYTEECDKPLTIAQDEFISTIGLPICKDVVPLPPKETPEQSLILSSEKVNADDGADKSLSRTIVQPVRVILPKKQVAKTQHAKEPVTTADATKSLGASKSAEEQVLYQIVEEEVKDVGTSDDYDVIDITPKDDEEGDASDSGLRSMPDDDLASLIVFETSNSVDDDFKEGTAKTFHASADMPVQSDPLGPLHEELCILHTKIDKGSERPSSSDVQQTLKDQLPNILLKPMNREFNTFNTLESHRFVLLQKELRKIIKTKMGKSVKENVRKGMSFVSDQLASVQSSIATNSQHVFDLRQAFYDMNFLLESAEVF
ncbi:hypothetical protein Tco_1354236 [Tanacetum coccineum]